MAEQKTMQMLKEAGDLTMTLRYEYARELMDVHGLQNWELEISKRAKKVGGVCGRKGVRKYIRLSWGYMQAIDDLEFEDTVLHEIAHALVGIKEGHNYVWYRKAKEIGCSGKIYHNVVYTEPKWKYTCENGCWEVGRHRRSNVSRKRCGRCKGKVFFKEV